MNTTRRLALMFVAAFSISACSSSPDEVDIAPISDAETEFNRAQESLGFGNFSGARDRLDAFLTRYPFGPYSQQAQLDLIYINYKLDDFEQALAQIDRFLSLNPNHKDIDYVMYMRGLVNQRAEYNAIQALAGIDRADRDPSFAKQAFADFAALLSEFPTSPYAADAKQRMVWLQQRLARYEVAVAEYYMKREAYLAAANRGRYVLEYFQTTPQVERALEIMIEAYDLLELTELANEARATLAQNFPNNEYIASR